MFPSAGAAAIASANTTPRPAALARPGRQRRHNHYYRRNLRIIGETSASDGSASGSSHAGGVHRRGDGFTAAGGEGRGCAAYCCVR